MLTYHLGVDDLARVRLAFSPMGETTLSLWPLTLGTHDRPYLAAWHRHALAEAHRYDDDLIRALVSPSGFQIPDFISPIPTKTRPTLAEECELIAAADPEQVRRDLVDLCEGAPPHPSLAPLMDDPVRAAAVIADALVDYHEAVIAPFWSDITRVLESDITFRGREFAQRGVAGLFDGLTDGINWSDDGTIAVRLTCDRDGMRVSNGHGVVLTPSVFTKRAASWHSNEPAPAWLSYPARGQGTLAGEHEQIDHSRALTSLIGGAKAEILHALTEPASTSELARRFSVTPSAVSQNLRVLADNGLVESSRHGREVLYRLSDVGRQLVGRQTPALRSVAPSQDAG